MKCGWSCVQVDANVVLVDWGRGAQLLNYLQVASNTRIVGAEVARLVMYYLRCVCFLPLRCKMMYCSVNDGLQTLGTLRTLIGIGSVIVVVAITTITTKELR